MSDMNSRLKEYIKIMAQRGAKSRAVLDRLKLLIELQQGFLLDTEHPEAAELVFDVMDEYSKATEGFINYMNKVLVEKGTEIKKLYGKVEDEKIIGLD